MYQIKTDVPIEDDLRAYMERLHKRTKHAWKILKSYRVREVYYNLNGEITSERMGPRRAHVVNGDTGEKRRLFVGINGWRKR